VWAWVPSYRPGYREMKVSIPITTVDVQGAGRWRAPAQHWEDCSQLCIYNTLWPTKQYSLLQLYHIVKSLNFVGTICHGLTMMDVFVTCMTCIRVYLQNILCFNNIKVYILHKRGKNTIFKQQVCLLGIISKLNWQTRGETNLTKYKKKTRTIL